MQSQKAFQQSILFLLDFIPALVLIHPDIDMLIWSFLNAKTCFKVAITCKGMLLVIIKKVYQDISTITFMPENNMVNTSSVNLPNLFMKKQLFYAKFGNSLDSTQRAARTIEKCTLYRANIICNNENGVYKIEYIYPGSFDDFTYEGRCGKISAFMKATAKSFNCKFTFACEDIWVSFINDNKNLIDAHTDPFLRNTQIVKLSFNIHKFAFNPPALIRYIIGNLINYS